MQSRSEEAREGAAPDLRYAYDASDNRVLKTAIARENNQQIARHSVYISGGQELRGAQFGASYVDSGTIGSSGDYQIGNTTEVGYLFAHGVRLGRVAYDNNTGTGAMPAFSAVSAPKQHVLINLGDTLGSTAIVLDQATGELVESTTYLAHGATESDYRPSRWQGLREDYKFTGKEEDVEVGLQYFGKRFLSPYLNRWVSPDPLAVHVPGKADWNLYAYVEGAVLKAVDPLGLTCGVDESCAEVSTSASNGASTFADGTNSTEAPSIKATQDYENTARKATFYEQDQGRQSKQGANEGPSISVDPEVYLDKARQGLGAILGGPVGTTGFLETYAAHQLGGDTVQQSFDRANEVAAAVAPLDDVLLGAGAGRARALEQSQIPPAPDARAGGGPTRGSPTIGPDDLTGKTQDELRQFAADQGLVPHPSKPDKFMDPVTGKERLRLDPGHIDKQTGLPYKDPNAAVPHAHGYELDGKTKVRDSLKNPHFPTK